jgi:hypothetical protein
MTKRAEQPGTLAKVLEQLGILTKLQNSPGFNTTGRTPGILTQSAEQPGILTQSARTVQDLRFDQIRSDGWVSRATRLATLHNSVMPGPLTPRHKGTVCGDDDTPL